MLLKTTHVTELDYSGLIAETVMELRMAPRQEQRQHRLSFDLSVGPPSAIRNYFDWLGNTVHTFSINGLHRRIKIIAVSVVDTARRTVELPAIADRWPLESGLDYTLFDFLQLQDPVADCAELDALAKQMTPAAGSPLHELVLGIVGMIGRDFRYEQGITTATSTIADVLKHGGGVCQDFTHLMIALLRKLGVPARYVSGFIYAGHRGYRGASQSHAWVEVFFPSIGWIGFDPTNGCATGENFVKIAVGRHYRDVPPHRGVYRSNAKETMKVEVNTEELAEVSNRLVGERVLSLDVPVLNGNISGQYALGMLDEQVQQQQQTCRPFVNVHSPGVSGKTPLRRGPEITKNV